jgi:protein-S-isoprenylcysteine O-methyltransferase Ste14
MKSPALYKWVRHPMYLGILIGIWSTPQMTGGHLLFAAGMTVYVLIGIAFEEKDLVRDLGDDYRRYQERTPALIPRPPKKD